MQKQQNFFTAGFVAHIVKSLVLITPMHVLFAFAATAQLSQDCTVNFTGIHDRVGLSNGDTRFMCFAGWWHECGWERSEPNWAVEVSNGQSIGSWTCDLTDPNAPIWRNVADTQPPTVPTGLSVAVLSPAQLVISWNSAIDFGGSGISGYVIIRSDGITRKVTIAGPSTTFVDTEVSPNTRYCYMIRSRDYAGNKSLPSVPQCISTPVVTANVISACQEINRPGDYVLSGDIHAGVLSDSGCLNVHDTASVNIDCQGHTINTPAGVKFENVQNFSLKNCVIVGLGSPNPYPLVVRTSRDGTISNNTLGEINSNVVYTFNIDRGDGLLISENRINSVLQQYLSKDNTISANTFVSPVSLVRGKIIPGCVISTFGTNNLITGNTIDGRAIGGGVSVADDSGADDGIILMDESATTVSNNSIRNVWDAGIEWLGLLDRVTIIGNTITNALYTGIGGWYFMGLAHSTISRNIVSRTPRLFVISRTYGLRPAGYDPRNPSAPEKAIYFTNNRFESNVLANPVPDGQTAVAHTEIFVFSNNNQLGYTGYPGGGNIAPRPSDFILTDNVFINNDFSKDAGSPFFGVSNSMWGIIIDGGGNRCSYDRLNMFSPNYPLNCN